MGNIFRLLCLLVIVVGCCSNDSQPLYDDWNNNDFNPFYSSVNLKAGDKKTRKVARFFTKYGYTQTYTEDLKELKESIKDFQYFGGLEVTGELDYATEKLMDTNRCGIRDPDVRAKRLGRGGRYRRYNHQGTKWTKRVLTWRYKHDESSRNAWRSDNKKGLKEDDVRAIITKAMNMWQEKIDLTFVEERQATDPDIWVTFPSFTHNDPFPFDGPGGTLAHAFYPLDNRKGLPGDVHFDDSERFTIGRDPGNTGRDLMWVAVHELGHTLGLDHSGEQAAVMYPYYMGYKENMQLANDDTVGIQELYGAKKEEPTKTTPKPKPKKKIPIHKRCPISKITDVWDYKHFYMTISEDGKLYVVSKNNGGMRYANIEARRYYRVPDPIDTVLQTNLGRKDGPEYNIIFTGDSYYIFVGFKQKSGPHSIHDGNSNPLIKLNFPKEVKKIDAAMKWWPNRKIYFFSGDKYWRYNEDKKKLDAGYPKKISAGWFGIPTSGVDSAYSSFERKETIFTKNDMLYRIKERPRPMRLLPGYPKSIKRDFLKCEEE